MQNLLSLLGYKNEMANTHYNISPVAHSMVRESYSGYASPNDKISRLVQDGELIRLKRGLYIESPHRSGALLSRELIANHLLGPSYISYETALSYYGLIPERVVEVRSATVKRRKIFTNELGRFVFISVPPDYFPVGIRIKIVENEYAFMIATPEKALCDHIIATSGLRMQSVKAVREYLYEDMRIDDDAIHQFDLSIIEECIEYGYKRNDLTNLAKFIRNEQDI